VLLHSHQLSQLNSPHPKKQTVEKKNILAELLGAPARTISLIGRHIIIAHLIHLFSLIDVPKNRATD